MDSGIEQQIGLSVDDAAQLTTLSTKTIRRAISRGDLPAYKAGTRIVLKREDVQDWLFSVPSGRQLKVEVTPSASQVDIPDLANQLKSRKVRKPSSRSRSRGASGTYAPGQTQPRRGSLKP
jgi:excisionase family DNA binding protein